MAKYLAIYKDTIGYGVEINGFVTMTEKERSTYEDLALSIGWNFTMLSGEEEIEYTSGDDLFSRIDFEEISNEEYKIFEKRFEGSFGVFPDLDFLNDVISDEKDDEDELDEDYDDQD